MLQLSQFPGHGYAQRAFTTSGTSPSISFCIFCVLNHKSWTTMGYPPSFPAAAVSGWGRRSGDKLSLPGTGLRRFPFQGSIRRGDQPHVHLRVFSPAHPLKLAFSSTRSSFAPAPFKLMSPTSSRKACRDRPFQTGLFLSGRVGKSPFRGRKAQLQHPFRQGGRNAGRQTASRPIATVVYRICDQFLPRACFSGNEDCGHTGRNVPDHLKYAVHSDGTAD